MSVNRRVVRATADEVWAVLADGWLYPSWVVGASRMREVSENWPAEGARLHHSVGSWPLLLDDHTEVLACRPRSELTLRAHAWPSGAAEVTLRLRESGRETEVVIEERAVQGPGALVPGFVQDPLLGWRNVETLRRLAHLAERRTGAE